MKLSQFAVSPCSNPDWDLDQVLTAYSALGYRKFEVFTSWARSAFDYTNDPAVYLKKGRAHNMAFTSMHLPPVMADNLDAGIKEAVTATRFAAAIGANVVLFKAQDRPTYIKAALPFLDAIESINITPVLQNHCGSALTTLDDVKEVHEGIADPRMKALLEVGHFHSAGVLWPEAAEYLGEKIALVHIKDQLGVQSVPFGEGEIDLPGLFRYMDERDYTGNYVIEMEVKDAENTIDYLVRAINYVKMYCEPCP